MPKLPQIRGALLEEAILYLLKTAGFSLAAPNPSDPTVVSGRSGLEVKGRGANHQIDAIADFPFSPLFSHPQRLLVEAKFLGKPVGLQVVRNAVGVAKDVNEYWHREQPMYPAAHRYHYLNAVFSASGFSRHAEEYAFAQDVFLFPLRDSHYLNKVVRAIRGVHGQNFGRPTGKGITVRLADLRREIREGLVQGDHRLVTDDWDLNEFAQSVRDVGGALIGMAGGFFPILLVPRLPDTLANLESGMHVQVRFDRRGWYLVHEGQRIFSFQLPGRLFQLYARGGRLEPLEALRLKREQFSRLDLVFVDGGVPRLLRLQLDAGWVDEVERHIRQRNDA